MKKQQSESLPDDCVPERYNVGIKELPTDERPRERLINNGPGALSAAELIAIVLRTGTADQSALSLAQTLLTRCGGLYGLSRATINDLKKTKGIGQVKGVQVAAFVELGKRLAIPNQEEGHALITPYDAAQYFMPKLRGLKKETFKVALLDTKGRVMKEALVSIGSVDSSIVKPREVFAEAVAAGARSVGVAQNDPSGDRSPD